jgi:hypothetical protein
MEIKLVCDCGQEFNFDVEPVNGQMPYVVNCPGCGTDRTDAATAMLAQTRSAAEPTMTGVSESIGLQFPRHLRRHLGQ